MKAMTRTRVRAAALVACVATAPVAAYGAEPGPVFVVARSGGPGVEISAAESKPGLDRATRLWQEFFKTRGIEVRVVKVDQSKRRIELSLLELPGDKESEPEFEDDDGEEGEGETMTAMELAWRSAMERQGMSIKVPVRKKGKRRRKSDIRREQASSIARTLQSKKS